jgi:predicted ester cyclase
MGQAETERNKQAVRRMFDEIINHGKLELVDDLFDPAFTSTGPDGTMDREGFRAYVEGWRAGFSDLHCEVGDLIAEGDQVAWSIRASGVHTGDFNGIPATGRSIDFDSLNTATFRDGRALQHRVVMDLMTTLTQLGVLPAPG